MNELGKLLEELRGKRSLREVAKATGLSHTYIRDIEIGIRRGSKTPITPSPEALKKLSHVYQYPYGELLKKAGYLPEDFDNDRLEDSIRTDLKLRKIFRAAEELTDEQKDKLYELMEMVFPDVFKNNK